MRMKNLTEGDPLGLIVRFSIPLLLGNLLQQAYNIVDYTVIGRFLGSGALAGVGASTSVQFLVLGFCIGLCAGFGIPVAQVFGAGDHRALRKNVFHAMALSLALAAVMTAVCACCTHGILRMLSTPREIYEDAYRYLLVVFLGIPFTILYNLLASLLRAVGDSRTPFVFLAAAALLNVILDLMAIAVWKLGVTGTALATVGSQAVSGLLCAAHIMRRRPELWIPRRAARFERQTARKMLAMAVPMGLQSSITAIGSMVMQTANNSLGAVYVSGYTVAMRVKQAAMCPFDAFAVGVSTFCGQNLGARQYGRIRAGHRLGLAMGVGYGLVCGAALVFLGRTFSSLFLSDPAVLDAAGRYLFFTGISLWVLGLLFFSRMTIQGLGHSGLAVFSGVIEMLARAGVSLLLVPAFGYAAICVADQCAWLGAALYVVPMAFRCVRRAARPRLTVPAGR